MKAEQAVVELSNNALGTKEIVKHPSLAEGVDISAEYR